MQKLPSSWIPLSLAAPLGYVGVALVACAAYASGAYEAILEDYPFLEKPFAVASIPTLLTVVRVGFAVAGVLAIGAGLLGYRRTPGTLNWVRKACVAGYAVLIFYAWALYQGFAAIPSDPDKMLRIGGPVQLFSYYWQLVWPAGAAAVGLLALHGHALRAQTIGCYTGETPAEPAPGDRAFEHIRRHGGWIPLLVGAVCGLVAGLVRGYAAGVISGMEEGFLFGLLVMLGVVVGLFAAFVVGSIVAFAVATLVAGRDEQYSRSLFTSVWGHLLVIVVIPWLLVFLGCVEPYHVPQGSGNPVQKLVKMVQPKKKKQKKLVVNPKSAIVYHQPEMFEEVLEEVKKQTEQVYKANPNRVAGRMGKGGGDEGGWPDGIGDEPVRFIRLEYGAPGWDFRMSDARGQAELEFLEYFKKKTSFKVSNHTESVSIYDLPRFPEGEAPPFLYVTGHGPFSIGNQETKILREYLLNGGMLFADAGSSSWHRSFKSYVQRKLFPGTPMRIIAKDDPIFRQPFSLTDGVAPLWHHGGSDAMGVKKDGRWVIFYHPGDLKDAWVEGHSGIDPELAETAYKIGVNIIYYAFTNYLEATAGERD